MKTILIILMAFLALRIILRFMKPYIMKFVMRKIERKINNTMGFDSAYQEPKKQKKDSISIDKIPETNTNKGDTSNLGEYIEYEEIE